MDTLRGHVVSKAFGTGSKSEHEAVVLVTDAGEYVLRRRGGNPFFDPELDGLVGKEIVCEGDVAGYTMIMSDWQEVAPHA
ncbi:MAG: hypothetical protein JST22_10335 [Bacteroidetes bacterium]|nr:hypothetical protein [Bacteroidota bacterium]HVZ37914.1 hypothetical protein [Candidatus Kapabacteria bacterium]